MYELYEVTVRYGVHYPVSELIALTDDIYGAQDRESGPDDGPEWGPEEATFLNIGPEHILPVAKAIEDRERLTGWRLGTSWRVQP